MENRITQGISRKAVEELRAIYEAEFDDKLTDADFERMGIELLRFFDLLTKKEKPKAMPVSEDEHKALVHIRDCLLKNIQPTVRSIAHAINRSSSRSGQRMLENLIKRRLVWKDEDNINMKRDERHT